MEEVAHEPLPGDAIPLRRRSTDTEDSGRRFSRSNSQETPSSVCSKEKKALTEVELSSLPKISSVRDMFESSSRSSGSAPVFEFGESFRQKKRFEQLSEKERELEAKAAMRGFNEKDLFGGKTAEGEIDTSSLGRTFTFEMSPHSVVLPDGICRVLYKKANYRAMVFVVHRTRGMLLLHVNASTNSPDSSTKSQIPGGPVLEEEFLKAASESGSAQVQLQIAAREAAARQLYEKTGLDMRQHVNRFKPAVLRLNPPVDAFGAQYLKNEYDNKLYYFLQVDEEDFAKIEESEKTSEGGDNSSHNYRLKRPSEDPGDSQLKLRLRDDFNGFTFVQDPGNAANVLKMDGNDDATNALNMIMSEAAGRSYTPDAKATDYSVADSVPGDERNGTLAGANVRTVGEKQQGKPTSGYGEKSFHNEADLNMKSSQDTNEIVEVSCCCGRWW
jgi:hypothetical protein